MRHTSLSGMDFLDQNHFVTSEVEPTFSAIRLEPSFMNSQSNSLSSMFIDITITTIEEVNDGPEE
ncbi:hypothetical protein X798_02858, partial [Onchocerca flexuosa]